VSLHHFQNCNMLRINHFRNHGVEDEFDESFLFAVLRRIRNGKRRCGLEGFSVGASSADALSEHKEFGLVCARRRPQLRLLQAAHECLVLTPRPVAVDQHTEAFFEVEAASLGLIELLLIRFRHARQAQRVELVQSSLVSFLSALTREYSSLGIGGGSAPGPRGSSRGE
jgi:hypothetical protein